MQLPRVHPSLLGALLLACTPRPPDPVQDAPAPPSQPLEVAEVDLPTRPLPSPDSATAQAPFHLTASDGTGLEVVSLKAHAVVQGPLAFTELHLVFDNPQPRTIEGNFQIDLPQNAAISRFAMKVASGWQEGEVVPRQRARAVYEDFLHRKQDPALLEKQAGNRFSARVFPIPGSGRKELIVSYSQELPHNDVPYTLLLAGLPRLEHLDVEVLIDEAVPGGPATSLGGVEATRRIVELHEEDYAPRDDLRIESQAATVATGLRSGRLAVARVPVEGAHEPQPIEDLTILFDTSASQALGFDRKIRRLAALVDAIAADADVHLRVIAFDNDVAKVFDGRADDFDEGHMQALYTRRAMGASDLQYALERLKLAGVSSRVLLMTDGVATAGKDQVVDLRATVEDLGRAGMRRIDAIIDGGLRDADVLASITTALPTAGVVAEATLDPERLVSKLTKATYTNVEVAVPDSAFVWPATVSGIQPGDEVLVYADLPEDVAMTVSLRGEHTIASSSPRLTKVERPLLERALVSARIAAKTLERSALPTDARRGREALAEEIVSLSTKYRVLSDFTALLVLETEWDYQRFDIDRHALANILTVDATGLTLLERGRLGYTLPAPRSQTKNDLLTRSRVDPEPVRDGADPVEALTDTEVPSLGNIDEDVWGGLSGGKVAEAYGVGGLGLVGTGRGGGGTGEGTIGLGNTGLIGSGGGGSSGSGSGSGYVRGRGRRVPHIRQAKAVVRGSLDKDIVRRIVRAHINEVRYCYTQALEDDINLSGRVTVRFTIGATGNVTASSLGTITLPDRSVADCIEKAVKRWKFPKPRDGGVVEVTYPFVLGNGGGSPLPPETAEARDARMAREREEEARRLAAQAERERLDAYEGKMRDVMTLLDEGDAAQALTLALQWRDQTPADVLALLAVGEALEATGAPEEAARAYASLIDLFPARADLRRYAGYRLDRLGAPGRRLAVDTYRHAVEQRPDHPNSHRLLAYALLRDGRLDEALDAIEIGVAMPGSILRFAGVQQVLREDMRLIAAAAIAKDPSRAEALKERLAEHGLEVSETHSTRFIMSWETDLNDVDFHIHDARGGHAYYADRTLASGGHLYADVTTGYGPECFTIEGEPLAFPYRFEANYYARGPMGYGMGKLEVIQHDGKGGLTFDHRPFVIMKDHAYVPLGTLDAPL